MVAKLVCDTLVASGGTPNNLTFDASGNVTVGNNLSITNASARFLGDFTNTTVSSRLSFQTSTTNGSTGIYALPNGSSTAASWQATNNADPTNASKILIATNGSTDVQLVSGRNGSGTYLPLSFYTNGSQQMQLDTSGNLGLGVSPSAWVTNSRAIQIGAYSSFFQDDGGAPNISQNAYESGAGTYKYLTNFYATKYTQQSGQHQWYTAASGTTGAAITFTPALTLNANGVLALQGGNTSATGTGIAFPSTQSASSDANTLDDYEEGTWTPTIGGTATYTIQEGYYVKVGRIIHVQCKIQINVIGTGSTTLISGLPYASINATNSSSSFGAVGYFSTLAAAAIVLTPVVTNNATTLSFASQTASATTISNTVATVFASSTRVDFSVVYEAAS